MSLQAAEQELEGEPQPADDRALLKRLARACRSGAVAIEPDMNRLRHIHSPVLSQADGNQWLLGGLAVAGGLWWRLGWHWAAAAAPLWLLLYLGVGRRTIRRRLMQRIDRRLDDPLAWNMRGEFGGVGLHERSTDRRCAAPDEDWRSLARSLRRQTEALR
jgi:hypothetical protein